MAIMYWNVEQKCRRFNKIMGTYVILVQAVSVIAVLFSIYCVIVGNFDTSTYYLPLRIAPPFNIDSLFGWYLFLLVQLCLLTSYIFAVVPVITYFVCCCYYLNALCDHFEFLISLVQSEVEQMNSKRPNEQAKINEHALNARKFLCNAIDHHNKIHE